MPKKPSTLFMMEVCSEVDREMSPMSASAPVLKTPMARPDRAMSTEKHTNELPAMNRYDEAAKIVRPATMVRFSSVAVRQMSQEEAGHGDARHGRVLKGSSRGQAQAEGLDDLGNDDARPSPWSWQTSRT